jgi:hypothetical protein
MGRPLDRKFRTSEMSFKNYITNPVSAFSIRTHNLCTERMAKGSGGRPCPNDRRSLVFTLRLPSQIAIVNYIGFEMPRIVDYFLFTMSNSILSLPFMVN